MIQYTLLRHEFVKDIPERLEPGILYISIKYSTAVHSCCCGCGIEIVTPFTPTDWKMTFDGETISLHPSIGNWNEPCRSHYVIERGQVIEARPWSNRQIKAEVQRDTEAKRKFYENKIHKQESIHLLKTSKVHAQKIKSGFWQRLSSYIKSKKISNLFIKRH